MNLLRLFGVSMGLVGLGLLACRPFFKSWKEFRSSSLFIKTLMWVPILSIFILYLKTPPSFKFILPLLILGFSFREIFINRSRALRLRRILYLHLLIGALALSMLSFVEQKNLLLLTFVVYSSVISDVAAFFFGNYIGKHKLPKVLNDRKSWEGVIGQLLGAVLGGVMVNILFLTHAHVSLYFAVVVGLGTAFGDLLNSYVKRQIGIKDWGNSIPGHGGYADRFSSMFGAATFVFISFVLK